MKTPQREEIARKVMKMLDSHGFQHAFCEGCFDIVARKKQETFLLKILMNVDAFQEEQARSLGTISSLIGAKAFLIGTRTRREHLADNIIYERFGIPVLTPDTFESIIFKENEIYVTRFRGGLFSEINPQELRRARISKGLTQSELAEKVGISKKAVYEHESRPMRAHYMIAEKIEGAVGKVMNPVKFEITTEQPHNYPKGVFERNVSKNFRRMGFSTSFVYKTSFNIIAKEKEFILVSEADDKFAEKKAPQLYAFSKVSKKPAIIVTKKEIAAEVPSLSEKELRNMDVKDLKKVVKKGRI
jgi:putative transcriptional regulator